MRDGQDTRYTTDSEASDIDAGDLLDLIVKPGWHRDALCREYPDLNFVEPTKSKVEVMKAICSGCLVRAECLASATDDDVGIWGGLTKAERTRLRYPVRSAA